MLFFSIITWEEILPHRRASVREATLHFNSRNHRTLRLRQRDMLNRRGVPRDSLDVRALDARTENMTFSLRAKYFLRRASRQIAGCAIYAQSLTCVGLIHQPLIDFHHRWHVCQGFAERRHVAAIAFDGFFTGIIGRECELQIAVEACQ